MPLCLSPRNGLSTYPEVVNAERGVTSARSVGHNTRAAIFTSAAALALSIGELAKPPLPRRYFDTNEYHR